MLSGVASGELSRSNNRLERTREIACRSARSLAAHAMERRRRVRKGIALAILVVVVPHAGIAGDAGGAARPPEALQSLWNESMLDGRSLNFYDGKEIKNGLRVMPAAWRLGLGT